MGRQVLGVLYGCVVPTDLKLRKELRAEEDELLDKWEKGAKNRKLNLDHSDPDGDKYLIGFWVGIGGDKKGAPDISGKCLPLTVIEKSKAAKKAVDSWKVFAAFSKENGVNLPSPTFWFAPTEIG